MARFVRTPGLNSLCTPAYLYLILSIVILILTGIMMNTDGMKMYYSGRYTPMQIIMFFALKLVFVVFWTWILNILCRGGAGWLSWFLVLFPFIMMFAVFLTVFGSVLTAGGRAITSYGQQVVPPNVVMPNVVQPNVVMPPVPHGDNNAMLVNSIPAPRM